MKIFMYAQSHSGTDHTLVISWYLLGQTITLEDDSNIVCLNYKDISGPNGFKTKFEISQMQVGPKL